VRFVVLVEGDTERRMLGCLLGCWLNKEDRLATRIGVHTESVDGCPATAPETVRRARRHLAAVKESDVIAVAALSDWYTPQQGLLRDMPKGTTDPIAWAASELERRADLGPRFRAFFAVHDIEAWLWSQPDVFPRGVAAAVGADKRGPEEVDENSPPSQRLKALYRERCDKGYMKTVHGPSLFQKLDAELAYAKCPHLAEMLDWMLEKARAAGLSPPPHTS